MTDNEKIVLRAFIQEGIDCNGAETTEDLINDNMTWMDADDIAEAMNTSDMQSVGGIMSSLEKKGLISDSGEPLPERKQNAFTATDEGIRQGWVLL